MTRSRQTSRLELAENFTTTPASRRCYRANPQLTRAQVNLVLVGLADRGA